MSEAQRIAAQLDKIYDSDMTNRLVAALSSPLYTIADIEQLAEKYVLIHGIKDDLTPQLFLSLFLEWLKRREKEEGGR